MCRPLEPPLVARHTREVPVGLEAMQEASLEGMLKKVLRTRCYHPTRLLPAQPCASRLLLWRRPATHGRENLESIRKHP